MIRKTGRRVAAVGLVATLAGGITLGATSCVPKKYCYGSYAAMRCYDHPRHA